MPLILPGNVGSATAATGYDVANSVRFDDGGNCQMRRAGVAGGNQDKFTLSMWIKRSNISTDHPRLFTSVAGGDDRFEVYFENTDELHIEGVDNGTATLNLVTNRKFRDISAWYHILLAVDTGQGTEANRAKLYINGVLETSLGTSARPDQNGNIGINTNSFPLQIGERSGYGVDFDGYLAEIVLLDGTQAANTDLGEFDEDSGIWKPIDPSGLTFGANGFYLDFESSGNLGNDVNGGTDFSEANLAAVDQSTDTCTNNGCTWNILYRNTATFTEGNLVYTAPSSNPVFGSLTTFGVTAGKWYAECKYHAGSNHYGIIGIADEVFATLSDLGSATNTDLGKVGASLGVQAFAQNSTVAYVINTGKIRNNNSNQNYGSGGGDGQIINIALDRDNRKVYFGINGTYENSGDPGAGSNGFDISGQVTGNEYFLGVTNDTGSSETILDFNFGSGFGLTAVSSANTDANGYGNFEYAVPSGFFAWNTKNLAEHG